MARRAAIAAPHETSPERTPLMSWILFPGRSGIDRRCSYRPIGRADPKLPPLRRRFFPTALFHRLVHLKSANAQRSGRHKGPAPSRVATHCPIGAFRPSFYHHRSREISAGSSGLVDEIAAFSVRTLRHLDTRDLLFFGRGPAAASRAARSLVRRRRRPSTTPCGTKKGRRPNPAAGPLLSRT
jgi:hypothetical protein